MSEPVHILSLGAGVQSSTLALMAAKGEVGPMPLCAIFADTQAEPPSVYRWLEWLEKQLPFPVHRVTAGSLTERVTTTSVNRKTGKAYYSNMIPAFTLNRDGTKGIIGRSCTRNYKIVPIMKKARQLAGTASMQAFRVRYRTELTAWLKWKKESVAARRKKTPPPAFPAQEWSKIQAGAIVTQWIGISLDEVSRMKDSRDPWAKIRWPLIEMRMNRHDCFRWMERNGYPTPPRSACSYCPFHSDAEWRRLRSEEPEEFAKAVEVERLLQAAHASISTPGEMQGVAYLHESLVPLDKVDFSTEEEHGQTSLFNNECEGMCGI